MQESTCDLYDRYGELARVAPPIFRDFGGRKRFSGTVQTIKCFEDNSRVKVRANQPGRGKILVVDGGGSTRCALLGDVIATEAAAQGWEGVVIFGCVRDSAILATLDLGIKALGATPRKSVKHGEGQLDLPVDIGGLICAPGDMLFADEDGIVVIAPGQLSSTAG